MNDNIHGRGNIPCETYHTKMTVSHGIEMLLACNEHSNPECPLNKINDKNKTRLLWTVRTVRNDRLNLSKVSGPTSRKNIRMARLKKKIQEVVFKETVTCPCT